MNSKSDGGKHTQFPLMQKFGKGFISPHVPTHLTLPDNTPVLLELHALPRLDKEGLRHAGGKAQKEKKRKPFREKKDP